MRPTSTAFFLTLAFLTTAALSEDSAGSGSAGSSGNLETVDTVDVDSTTDSDTIVNTPEHEPIISEDDQLNQLGLPQQDVLKVLSDDINIDINNDIDNDNRHQIAIIGAGVSGSSAAHHLKEYGGENVAITVFEKEDHVGGRSTTIDVDGYPVELGGAIFVDSNSVLKKGLQDYNLSLNAKEQPRNGMGVWNGDGFDFIGFKGNKIIDMIKFFLHCGAGVWKMDKARKQVVDEFLHGYYNEDINFPFDDASYGNFIPYHMNRYSTSILQSTGASPEYFSFVKGVLRAIYGQNVEQVQSWNTILALTARGANTVKGGFHQLFKKWIDTADADLKLSTCVKSICKLADTGKYEVTYQSDSDHAAEFKKVFDYVIIASPLRQSGIAFHNVTVDESLYETEYVPLWMTVVKSKLKLSESPFFNDPETPQTVVVNNENAGFNNIVKIHYNETTAEYIYRLESAQPLKQQFLEQVFGEVLFKYEKHWLAYPYLKTIKGESIKLQLDKDAGLWNLNSFERFTSTLETSALVGASVAGLITSNGGFNVTRISVPSPF
ncbi:unnamed protein product [Ambrosiozyma monospora]|uniref:Unnamed protein product n=1 Tax=Ambrosiozyma monospora TaxID=43982 RepID=A0A9W6Z226_AMBMO|nr:unnamed protein product [Ambrosiozyma monospora]